ncbi:hypothetical protein [Fluviicola taffensis]|uniref:hypothetical protein n=1 Tax=Fluviicola taffensis TaxID=191579 RepID=UPI003137AC62
MKISFLFSIFLISIAGFAQKNDSIKSKRFPAYIIKSSLGIHSNNNLTFTNAEWERRTPGVSVPDSFQVNSNGEDHFNADPYKLYWMHSISLIQNKEKQAGRNYRFTTLFHLGIGPEIRADKYWFHENREVLDTLISLQTGDPYYVMGNRRQDIQKSYRSKSTMLGFGEHFATNPESIFQFETGVDVFAMFNSSITESYVKDSYIIEGVTSGSYNSLSPQPVLNEPQSISHKGRTLYGILLRLPLELSVPLSYKNPVLKRMRLGVELNIGVTMYFTKGKTNFLAGGNSGVNFRYEFYEVNRHFLSKRQKPVSN